jgi:hypothetical protein
VDLRRGTDTLVFSQNYSVYSFERVAGQANWVIVSREGRTTTLKNVELFEFADGTKGLAEILAAAR